MLELVFVRAQPKALKWRPHTTSERRHSVDATPGRRFGIIQIMALRPANASVETNSGQVGHVSPPRDARFQFPNGLMHAVERCWRKADAPVAWQLDRDHFQAALERSVAHRFGTSLPDEKAVEIYLESLQVRDLALACACSAGISAAWDFFVAQFRPELYRAARVIAGETNARELADSLYADLYGLRESEGRRKSLFDYFHGRSKLGTWLRAVLAQRHVDEIRRSRRTEPLENDSGEERREIAALASHAASASPETNSQRTEYLAILQAALTAAIAGLEPRDRLRLAYYYADGRTLAEIGNLLGEHEATVSRKLDRSRRNMRQCVEVALRRERDWDDAQVNHCLEYARGEWPFDLTESLRSGRSPAKPSPQTNAASARD